MPSLSGRHDGRRILIPVAVLRSDDPADLTFVQGTALLDTGATSSGIGPRIVRELGLRSYAKRPLVVATEERLVDYFLFRLGFFAKGDQPTLPYIFAETDGFQIRAAGSFDVLLGMDVLKQCDLLLDRSGRWQLDFGGGEA